MEIEKYIARLCEDEVAIFLFHGVIKKPVSSLRNYNRKHISEKDFVELIKGLNVRNPISMDHFLSGRDIPPKAFIATFDDRF